MICLFLAVLEMVKTQSCRYCEDLFGEIALGKGERFDDAPAARRDREDYK